MTPKDRKRKLAMAEQALKDTTRRIRRLMTAQSKWQWRVAYHTAKLQLEQGEEYETKLAAAIAQTGGLAAPVTGRKFR